MKRLLLLTALLIIAACSRITYRVESQPGFSFGSIKTYQLSSDWSGKAAVRIHPEAAELLNKALEEELQGKGYKRGYPQPPDVIVSYRLESVWDSSLTPEQVKQRLGFSGSHFPDSDPRARDYQKLTLVLEAISVVNKKVVWSGRAIGVNYATGAAAQGLVDSAERLIRDFPTSN